MPCGEYKKLNLLHEYAERRVLRYARPEEEPRLVTPQGVELKERLSRARIEERDTRLAMQNHKRVCIVCDQTPE